MRRVAQDSGRPRGRGSVPGRTSDRVAPGSDVRAGSPFGRGVGTRTHCLGGSSASCPFVPSRCHGTGRRSFVPGRPSRPRAQTPFRNSESLFLQLHPTTLLKGGVRLGARRAPSPLPRPPPAPLASPAPPCRPLHLGWLKLSFHRWRPRAPQFDSLLKGFKASSSRLSPSAEEEAGPDNQEDAEENI